MRLIDADKLCPDCFTRSGKLAISQSQIAEAPTVERPQGECDCSDCDYFKFSQSFIENVVKFMTDYNIETVEDLMKELNHINELLGGKQ